MMDFPLLLRKAQEGSLEATECLLMMYMPMIESTQDWMGQWMRTCGSTSSSASCWPCGSSKRIPDSTFRPRPSRAAAAFFVKFQICAKNHSILAVPIRSYL